jgi:hypothetical protein
LKGVMPFGRMHKSGLYLGGTSLMFYGSATFGMDDVPGRGVA